MKEVTATNYHGEVVIFSQEQTVTHVDENEKEREGVIKAIDNDDLHIEFFDGDKEWKKTSSCY